MFTFPFVPHWKLPLKTTKRIALGVFLLEIIIFSVICVMSAQNNADEFEHIHASWLVWSGKVPYRDFFEHHNPLLWYIFAPITALFYDHAEILYAGHFFGLTANLITLIFLYKTICRFIGSPLVAATALMIFTSFNFFGRVIMTEFRPDTYMQTCFFVGLYYYLDYMDTQKYKKLSLAFIFFTLSALFLQKILLLLFFLGLYTLWLAAKGKAKITDIAKACLIPAGIIAVFFLCLWHANALEDWYRLNITLNALIPQYYGFHIFTVRTMYGDLKIPLTNGYAAINFEIFTILICALAILFTPRFLKTGKTDFRRLIVFIFSSELFLRLFTFSPYHHYFFILTILATIICATAIISYHNKKISALLYLLLIYWFIVGINETICHLFHNNTARETLEHTQFVIDNSEPDDILINGNGFNFNLFRPDADYIWFSLNDAGYIYDLHFNKTRYNVNQDIEQKRPKIIYVQDYDNTPYGRRRQKTLTDYNYDLLQLFIRNPDEKYQIRDIIIDIPLIKAQTLDMDMIKKYYKPTGVSKFWIKKDDTDL